MSLDGAYPKLCVPDPPWVGKDLMKELTSRKRGKGILHREDSMGTGTDLELRAERGRHKSSPCPWPVRCRFGGRGH